MVLAKEVWETLSAIDVSSHVEKKNNLNYLSWAWAWATLMSKYPDADYSFSSHTFPDTTVEITATVTIKKGDQHLSRSMWLPVMNYKNQAVKNPDAFAVNSCKMRCLVKCLAMFGLGFTIYAGSELDVPADESDGFVDPQEAEMIRAMVIETKSDMEKFCSAFGIDAVEQLKVSQKDKAIMLLRRKLSASK